MRTTTSRWMALDAFHRSRLNSQPISASNRTMLRSMIRLCRNPRVRHRTFHSCQSILLLLDEVPGNVGCLNLMATSTEGDPLRMFNSTVGSDYRNLVLPHLHPSLRTIHPKTLQKLRTSGLAYVRKGE